MDCDQAANLLSARIDGELSADDGIALDAHLAECAICRAALHEGEVQDAALIRAFAPQQEAAAALAERVTRELVAESGAATGADLRSSPWRMIRWAGWAAAASVGFVAAMLIVRLADKPGTTAIGPTQPQSQPQAQPIAHLTLATGEIFTCPKGEQEWRPARPGDAIATGARVRTSDAAKCELRLTNGTSVRLNSGTNAKLIDVDNVHVDAGQLWSAVPAGGANSAEMCVTTPGAKVTAGGFAVTPSEHSTQLDVACTPTTATVTVVRGAASVSPVASAAAKGATPTIVRGGEELRVPSIAPEVLVLRCASAPDPVLAARWQDELLVLKPHDDPEVVARAAELLSRITGERRASGGQRTPDAGSMPGPKSSGPGPVEQEVRALGQAWSASFACVARHPTKPNVETRRTAARLLADLAPPRCVPDLIELLDDEDGAVRGHAADALQRLTGQTLGFSAASCAGTHDPKVAAAWRAWWAKQKEPR